MLRIRWKSHAQEIVLLRFAAVIKCNHVSDDSPVAAKLQRFESDYGKWFQKKAL